MIQTTLNFMCSEALCILNECDYPIIGVVHNLNELIIMNGKKENSLGKIKHFSVNVDFGARHNALESTAIIEQIVIPAISTLKTHIGNLTGKFVSLKMDPILDRNCIVLQHKELVLRMTHDYDIRSQRKILIFDIVLLQIGE